MHRADLDTVDDYGHALRSGDVQLIKQALVDVDAFIRDMEDVEKRRELIAAVSTHFNHGDDGIRISAVQRIANIYTNDRFSTVKASHDDMTVIIHELKMMAIEDAHGGVRQMALDGLLEMGFQKPETEMRVFDAVYDVSVEAKDPFTRYIAKGALKEQFGLEWRPRLMAYDAARLASKLPIPPFTRQTAQPIRSSRFRPIAPHQ